MLNVFFTICCVRAIVVDDEVVYSLTPANINKFIAHHRVYEHIVYVCVRGFVKKMLFLDTLSVCNF